MEGKTARQLLKMMDLTIREGLIAVPTPNPWGPGKCQEVYKLVWKPRYSHLPGKWIGFVTVDNGKVHYAYLKRKFRGKGLGYLLYEMVLKHRGELSTSFHCISEEARGVWKRIREIYKSRLQKGTLRAYDKYK